MKKLFVLAGMLLAGCRSEQVAFQFQPATATGQAVAAPAATAGTAAIPAEAAAADVSAAAPATSDDASIAEQQLIKQKLITKPRLTSPLTARLAPLAGSLPLVHTAQLMPRLPLRHRATHGAAESGLGSIGLFFIAVLLGVLAGLAALVNLIFSVGFFTALGYTAAGLVALFLLYSLLSGSGKKKKTVKRLSSSLGSWQLV